MASSFEKYAAGALLGGVVGAAIGLLLAPRSGAETREIILQEMETKSREAAEALKEKSEIIKEKAVVLKEKVVELSTELEEKGETLVLLKEENQKTPEVTS